MEGTRVTRARHPLQGRQGVVLDTMIFIYLLEDHPIFAQRCEDLLQAMENNRFSGIITPITAAELLIKPIEHGREDVAERYRQSLLHLPNAERPPLTFQMGCLAGALRAKYKRPLPDMIQVAFALQSPRPTIVTNDKAFQTVDEVETFLLDDFA